MLNQSKINKGSVINLNKTHKKNSLSQMPPFGSVSTKNVKHFDNKAKKNDDGRPQVIEVS